MFIVNLEKIGKQAASGTPQLKSIAQHNIPF
jgi:hypothetical protein